MTDLTKADWALATAIMAAWYGDSKDSAGDAANAVDRDFGDAIAVCETARALVTAELAARAAPDQAGMIADILSAMHEPCDECAAEIVDAIAPHLVALQARAEKAEAEAQRLRNDLSAGAVENASAPHWRTTMIDPQQMIDRLTKTANYQFQHDPPVDKLLVDAALVVERLERERDALAKDNERLRKAIGYFLHDERFQVTIGGNPLAIARMLAEVRLAWKNHDD